MKNFLFASLMLVTASACSSTAKRIPSSVNHHDGEPQNGETFQQIQAIAKGAIGLDFKTLSLKDLVETPKGNSKKVGEWVAEGYYATLLGSYAAKDESFEVFSKIIDPEFKNYIKQKDHEQDRWSAYCSDFPDACNRAMIKSCKQLRSNEDSDWLRLKQALLNSGFTEKEIKTLNVKDSCDTSAAWWAGKCHITPIAQGLFPNEPKDLKIGDQDLGNSELTLAAYLLAEKQSNPDMFIRPRLKPFKAFADRDRNINPASLLTILVNTYGFHPGEYIYVIDRDSSSAIWNYLVKSYQLTMGDDLDAAGAEAIYSKLEKGIQYTPHAAPDTVHFKKAKLSMSLVEFDTPFEYGMVLEFDKDNQLIGGEWTETEHPDFIWGVPSDNESNPRSPVEKQLYDWLTKTPAPAKKAGK